MSGGDWSAYFQDADGNSLINTGRYCATTAAEDYADTGPDLQNAGTNTQPTVSAGNLTDCESSCRATDTCAYYTFTAQLPAYSELSAGSCNENFIYGGANDGQSSTLDDCTALCAATTDCVKFSHGSDGCRVSQCGRNGFSVTDSAATLTTCDSNQRQCTEDATNSATNKVYTIDRSSAGPYQRAANTKMNVGGTELSTVSGASSDCDAACAKSADCKYYTYTLSSTECKLYGPGQTALFGGACDTANGAILKRTVTSSTKHECAVAARADVEPITYFSYNGVTNDCKLYSGDCISGDVHCMA